MNIMRKFLAGGGSGSSGQGQSEDGDGSTVTPIPRPEEQELLGLSHLKKLFNEYVSPSHPLTEAEKEAKLYSMLPLFCKVSFFIEFVVVQDKNCSLQNLCVPFRVVVPYCERNYDFYVICCIR